MAQYKNLRTTSQLASETPAFSEAAIRWMIFRSKENGLDAALVRIGRRVFIDVEKFNSWLDSRRVDDARSSGA